MSAIVALGIAGDGATCAVLALAGGDHTAPVLVSHDGIDHGEVQDLLHYRWPDVVVKGLEYEEPIAAMSPADAIVVMPQHDRQVATPMIEPLPILD